MNEIWANRLIAGTKTWEQLPSNRINAVKSILRVRVEKEEITKEQYTEITGEQY